MPRLKDIKKSKEFPDYFCNDCLMYLDVRQINYHKRFGHKVITKEERMEDVKGRFKNKNGAWKGIYNTMLQKKCRMKRR